MGKARWTYLACGGWTMGWQGQSELTNYTSTRQPWRVFSLYPANDGAFDKVDNTISLLKGLQEHSKNHKYTVVDDEEGKGLRNSGYDVIINVLFMLSPRTPTPRSMVTLTMGKTSCTIETNPDPAGTRTRRTLCGSRMAATTYARPQ